MNKARAWCGIDGSSTPSRQVQLESVVARLANAYEVGRYELPPDELLRQLNEYTSGADIDYIVSLLGWEGNNLYTANMANERRYAIRNSEHAWRHSPLYQWAVWAWTNWGMGESVQVTPTDENARETFAEFWTAARNVAVLGQDKIHALSEWLLVKGDRYLVYFASTVDGGATIRNIDPAEFPDAPITDPQDKSLPLFYKRQWTSNGEQETLYYPDWAAFFGHPEKLDQEDLLPLGAKRADRPNGETPGNEEPGTVAVIQHIAHNRKDENDLRGWPLGTISGAYQRAHKRFMEDRLTVAAGKAMFVRRKQVDAGSRGLDSIKSTLQSSLASVATWQDTNPPAAAGSVEHDNKQVTTTDLPMTTGASDAKVDNDMFAWQALLGDGLFPTTAGLDTARYATALEMDKNQSMLWSRYRSFIAAQFRDMVAIVLSFREEYSNNAFPDKSAAVSIDTLNMVDFPPVMGALSEMFQNALVPLVDSGIIPTSTAKSIAARAWMVALQALGVEDAGDLTSLEAFGIVPIDDDGAHLPERGVMDLAISSAAQAIERAAARLGNGRD